MIFWTQQSCIPTYVDDVMYIDGWADIMWCSKAAMQHIGDKLDVFIPLNTKIVLFMVQSTIEDISDAALPQYTYICATALLQFYKEKKTAA